MSYAFCLQDLTTIGGPSGSAYVTQDASKYLDLTSFQDLVVWTDVKYFNAGGGSLSLLIETSPICDEKFFEAAPVVNVNTAGSGSTLLAVGVQINTVLLSSGNPISRWVRWRLLPGSATSAWQITFRIWVIASMPGMRLGLAGTPAANLPR